jgi:hypothetical protein
MPVGLDFFSFLPALASPLFDVIDIDVVVVDETSQTDPVCVIAWMSYYLLHGLLVDLLLSSAFPPQ